MKIEDIITLTFCAIIITFWLFTCIKENERFNAMIRKANSAIKKIAIYAAFIVLYGALAVISAACFILAFTAFPMWLMTIFDGG